MLIGIDLATKKTGICILDKNDNKVSIKYKDVIILDKFSQETLQANTNAILNKLNSLKIKFNINVCDKIFVEYNSGYTNTTACGLYAGLILSVFPQAIFIEAYAWQSLLFEKDYREKVKELGGKALSAHEKTRWTKIWARARFDNVTKNKFLDWTEDEIDAFWIAFLGYNSEPTFSTIKMTKAGLNRHKKATQTIRRKERIKRKELENQKREMKLETLRLKQLLKEQKEKK